MINDLKKKENSNQNECLLNCFVSIVIFSKQKLIYIYILKCLFNSHYKYKYIGMFLINIYSQEQ